MILRERFMQLHHSGLLLDCFVNSRNDKAPSSRSHNVPSGHGAGSAQQREPINQPVRLPQSLAPRRNGETLSSRAIGRSDPINNTHWIATLTAFVRNDIIQLTLFALLFSLLFSFSAHSAELLLQQQTLPDPHLPIDLQVLVTDTKSVYKDKITIVPPRNISFSGVLKTLPKKQPTGYLYTALQVMQLQPLPQVEYQVFMGAPATAEQPGDVIAVYVDNALAEKLNQQANSPFLETRAIWYGYHIYNFSRGPAIVIDNVALLPDTEN